MNLPPDVKRRVLEMFSNQSGEMITSATVSIPVPPSANAIWRSVTRPGSKAPMVLKSKAYRAWLKDATLVMRLTMPAITHPVNVVIRCGGKGFNRQRDIDNIIKPTLDALREAGRIAGDSVKTVRSVTAIYLPDGPLRCEVEVTRHAEFKDAA